MQFTPCIINLIHSAAGSIASTIYVLKLLSVSTDSSTSINTDFFDMPLDFFFAYFPDVLYFHI